MYDGPNKEGFERDVALLLETRGAPTFEDDARALGRDYGIDYIWDYLPEYEEVETCGFAGCTHPATHRLVSAINNTPCCAEHLPGWATGNPSPEYRAMQRLLNGKKLVRVEAIR